MSPAGVVAAADDVKDESEVRGGPVGEVERATWRIGAALREWNEPE